jgi:23S rRNA pseudouridine1911/1915/1917 synthase
VKLTVATDRGDIGVRIDRVLLRHLSHLPGVTRNRIQRLIERGAVLMGSRAVAKPSARVTAASVITIELPKRQPHTAPSAEDLPLEVVYEDDALLVVNKPPGQVSHPAPKHSSGTLLNALLAYARNQWVPSLVSRLDKGTSGLVLVAKSKSLHALLQRLAHDDGIEKDYLAIVRGKPPARGTINLALDRDPWDQRRVTVRDRGGVPSATKFQRLRVVRTAPDTWLSLVRCRLVTGRMHQIRVHLAAKGWPIVGDTTYGVKCSGIERQALHASRLAFSHPMNGQWIEATTPPPPDMSKLLERFDAREIGDNRTER